MLRIFALAPVGNPRAAQSSPLAVDGTVFTSVFNLVNAVVQARFARGLVAVFPTVLLLGM